ncbi:hypothetical protein BGX27_001976 [Mortierella sp. AM989]|nr:hypothetical protein BGX27_001976 [Mortierella sp. AM989]
MPLSLLDHGSWQDTQRTHWQPKGCMLRTYDVQHAKSCFEGSRIVMVGDSNVRHLYYSLVKKALPDTNTEGERHSDILIRDPESGTVFEFYWDPLLNKTTTQSMLSGSADRVMGRDERKPSIFLVGAGLWHLRYWEWSGGMEQWQLLMERLVRLMGNPRLEPLAQNMFISPITAVDPEKLSEVRRQSILPRDINIMNDFLRDAAKDSLVVVPFSWNKLTETASISTLDGLHYTENVVNVQADILLNYVCNNKLPKESPMSSTCCYDYPNNRWFQTLMLGIFLVWIPLGYIVQTYFRQHPVASFFPSVGVLRSFAIIAGAVVYMYYADRTSLFDKGNKTFSWSSFTSLMFLSIMAGSMTLKRSEKDQAFLNRDQTDEWKGWMQIVILIYHYVAASSVSAIYNPVRMLVASYLFMTGFGHFVFYYKKADFGFMRVASILVRLNLLTVLLTYTMNTNYLAYYFSPLVSFFYLTIYGMMYIGHTHNHKPYFIIGKILVTSIFTATIIHYPPVLDSVFAVIKFFYGVTWSAKEWRFRLELDVWVVFIGALFAYGLIKAQEMSITTHPHWDNIRRVSIFSSVIGLSGYFIVGSSIGKFEYNHWHPYISWIPILSFVVLRNSTAPLRNTVSTFYTFLGKCSLETFICQFHIWLAGDTKGILVISPWIEGTGAWTFNLALSSFVFLAVAHVLSKASGEFSDWLVSGREPKPSSHTLPSISVPVRTNTGGRVESGAGLPLAVKRQSVMVSPIAASAGAVGPATLKSMMETSLAMENLNRNESSTADQPSADLHGSRQKGVGSESSRMAGPSTANGSGDQAQRKENTVLRIDTSTEPLIRSNNVVTSTPRPSSIPSMVTSFKSIWTQPVGKVAIYFVIIWLLNYGST